jgi:hypothetical protein
LKEERDYTVEEEEVEVQDEVGIDPLSRHSF